MRELIFDVAVPVWAAALGVTLVALIRAWRRWRAMGRQGYEGLDDESDAARFIADMTAAGEAAEPVRTAARREVPRAEPTPAAAELKLTRVELFTRGAVVVDLAPHPIFDDLAARWAALQGAATEYVRFDWGTRELTGELVTA